MAKQEPLQEKRKQQIIYLLPSVKAQVDKARKRDGQSITVWIERAIQRALRRFNG